MTKQIAEHRTLVTRHKADLLFGAMIDFREAEAELDASQAVIDRSRFLASEANTARDKELRAIWARESRTRHDTAALEKRRSIGDQKRAWRVRFYNPEGKPRKSKPLELLHNAHAEVYCGGTADLFAFDNAEKHRLGSEEALEALDDKIRLQSWLNQVEQVEELFRPLAGPLEKMRRAASELPDMDAQAFTDVAGVGAGRAPPTPPSSSDDPNALALVPVRSFDDDYDFFAGVDDSGDPEPIPEPRVRFADDEAPWRRSRDSRGDRANPVAAWEAPISEPEPETARRCFVPKRKVKRKPVSRIPWSLLDELDAEKERFAMMQVADTMRDKERSSSGKRDHRPSG